MWFVTTCTTTTTNVEHSLRDGEQMKQVLFRGATVLRFELDLQTFDEVEHINSNKARGEREQINKSHWLTKVSHSHLIDRESFPKHHFLLFQTFVPSHFF